MNLRFLQDFQGRETNNRFFLKGETAEFEREAALVLIQDKRAEEVIEVAKVRKPEVEVIDAPEEPKKKVKK